MKNKDYEEKFAKSEKTEQNMKSEESKFNSEDNGTVAEDKEKEILEDSDQENYAEQTEDLKEDKDEETGSSEEDELSVLKSELDEAKDKYLRLYSEFDNFRRRTAKERLELVKTANEDLMVNLLSVADDFDRAAKAMKEQEDVKAVKQGIELIHHKFFKVLEQKGLKRMEDLKGETFDADIHEAITQIPAPEDKLKGKIVDVIENGYYLNDKVIRYAKVVIGA